MARWRNKVLAVLGCALTVALVALLYSLWPRISSNAATNAPRKTRDPNTKQAGQIVAPVQVKVTKVTTASQVVYRYSIVNGSAFPITAISIGNDDYSDETELSVAPLGWHVDSLPQTPSSSVESPPNWSFEFLPTEGGEPGTADWRAASPSEAILGGQTVSGFAVILSAAHVPYEQGHWTAYLNTSEEILYTGQLEPSNVTAVPLSSMFAKSDLSVSPNPTSGPVAIRFAVPIAGVTSVDIYDVQGRLVRRVLKKQIPAGDAAYSWDGRDEDGRKVAAGIYFVRVKTPTTTRFTRVTWLN